MAIMDMNKWLILFSSSVFVVVSVRSLSLIPNLSNSGRIVLTFLLVILGIVMFVTSSGLLG